MTGAVGVIPPSVRPLSDRRCYISGFEWPWRSLGRPSCSGHLMMIFVARSKVKCRWLLQLLLWLGLSLERY